MGLSPLQALATGAFMGAHSALRTDTGTPVGAWGFTPHGAIWSLWTKLSPRERLQVLQETPMWVSRLVQESGRPTLYNFILTSNRLALNWLRKSNAFAISPEVTCHGGGEYHYFETNVSPAMKVAQHV